MATSRMLGHAGACAGNPSCVLRPSGDPLVFGRAAQRRSTSSPKPTSPSESVPGITAAFAVAAELNNACSPTAAQPPSSLSPPQHHAADKLELTPKWEGAFPPDATLVIYMPGRRFRLLADELIASGIDPKTPCVAVLQGQHSRRTSPPHHLQTNRGRSHRVPPPSCCSIGHAIRLSGLQTTTDSQAMRCGLRHPSP